MREVNEIYCKATPASIEQISKMDYMHAVLKETLRLYDPVPSVFPRVAKEDHYLGNIKIPKNARVRPTPTYNFSHSKYFDEPEKFYPERWLKKESLDPFIFIPFSSGSRNCIGQHMAIIEAKVIIAEFLRQVNYEIPKDYKMKMIMRFLYEPDDKLTAKITPKTVLN